jgi:hypothetical protein
MSDSIRSGPSLAGIGLLSLYAAMTGPLGFGITAARELAYVAPHEAIFWLAHALFAIPGVLLLAYGVTPRVAMPVAAAYRRTTALVQEHPRLAASAYFLVLLAVALVGRRVILMGLPITDEENSVYFGAQVVASGRLFAPTPQPPEAFDFWFMLRRDGYLTSMDFPGPILFGAAGILTGLGSGLYALVSAAGGVAVVDAANRLAGARAALIAAAIWLCSPMVLTLSMTTHAHLLSRSFLAVAIAAYVRLLQGGLPSPRTAAVLGLMAGIAFLCRPFETGLILLPVAGHLLWLVWRDPSRWMAAVLAAVAACAIVMAFFGWYNFATTGYWYLPGRFAPGSMNLPAHFVEAPATRLGTHFAFTLLLLAIFFFGLLGIAGVGAGVARGGVSARVLAGGVVAVLLLTLVHDNIGIHGVGPIHYSEATVPLTIVAALGFTWLLAGVERLRWGTTTAAVLFVAYTGGGLGLFTLTHAMSLRRHAENQQLAFTGVRNAGIHRAVVIAPPPILLYRHRPEFERWGSWILSFPPPDPFLRDDIIFVRPDSHVADLRRYFPDRALYRMSYDIGADQVRLDQLHWPDPERADR